MQILTDPIWLLAGMAISGALLAAGIDWLLTRHRDN